MNTKNILLLNWRDTNNPYAGGAEVFAEEIAKRLVLDGNNVTWFSSMQKNLSSEEIKNNIRIIRKGSWKTVYIWAFFYYMFKLRKNTDIIIDCQNGIPFFSPLYSKKKVICVVHHVHREVFKHYSPSKFIKYFGILLESLIPIVYKKSTIITVSPSSKEDLQKILKVKNEIKIIYNGIDHSTFSPGKKSETAMILYLGRLKKYKRVNDLIIAFSIVLKKLPNSKCVIAGTGEELQSLKELAHKTGIEKNIVFENFVSETRKRELLQKAWTLIYPSTCEGWGISVIEANASGTPTIASNVKGLKDAVRNNETGLLFPVFDINQLANKIEILITNQELRYNLGKNSIEWAKKFSWEKSYNEFKQILEQ